MSRSGVTLVIMPTLALIKDQVFALRSMNIKAAVYTGQTDPSTKQTMLQMICDGDHTLKFIFATPEMSLDTQSISSITLRHNRGELQMVVSDEAHCVFTWGTSFRTAYQKCCLFKKEFPNVPILLLSASATVTVRKEIERILGLAETVLIVDTFNRPNISYLVKQKGKDSLDEIAELVKSTNSALIYCSKHDDVEYVAAALRSKSVSYRFFHAGLDTHLKKKLHNDWKEGKLSCLACTTAFGMGIDKPDVRVIIHYGLPHSLEDYYQETGRAGRDGLPSKAYMYCEPNDQNHIIRGIHGNFQAKAPETRDFRDLTVNIIRFQHLMKYSFLNYSCRRKVLLQYFGDTEFQDCNKGCDLCIPSESEIEMIDIGNIAKQVIACVQEIKQSLNRSMFTSVHVAEVISGKKSNAIKKHGHDGLRSYGSLKVTKETAKLILRHLVVQDILREVPDLETKGRSASYLDLGSSYLDILNGQLCVLFPEIRLEG